MDADALRTEYHERGYVRLPGGFTVEAAAAMAGAICDLLRRRHGIEPDLPGTWTITTPRRLGGLRQRGIFDAVGSPLVIDAVTALLGGDWPRPSDWGGALVTFPTTGVWAVPASGWHLDWPARGAPGSQLLVKWLGYVTPVDRGGGGTVVLAGSHRLLADHLSRIDAGDPGASRDVRDALVARHPALRDLSSLTEGGTVVAGVPVEVVELRGRPGDVIFLHPHLFHAAAPNRGSRPRFMVTGQAVRLRG